MAAKKNKKSFVIGILILVLLIVAGAIVLFVFSKDNNERMTFHPEYGQIYIYGETHANETILTKEFELWSSYYHENGMRHLFVELPYYTVEYLNIWMQADDNSILEQLYIDWEGTTLHSEAVLRFYEQIKSNCPETIFHGTDVGHQYNTTGLRYLEYLKDNNLADSDEYKKAETNIEQGKEYYSNSDNIYRENTMTSNFIQEFQLLNGESIMGIYGSAHTGIKSKDYYTNTIPCMANQLKDVFGANLHSEDLSLMTNYVEPISTDTMNIAGTEYEVTYYGTQDLSAFLPDFQYREFWRIENAYDDFKTYPTTGNVLPYDNYPFAIETGQIFMVRYTRTDGSVSIEYYRSDGNTWQNRMTTEEFKIE